MQTQVELSMSVFVQQPAQIPAAHAQSALAPYWLMHLGALGLFFVAVVDSSVVPHGRTLELLLPGGETVGRQARSVGEQ